MVGRPQSGAFALSGTRSRTGGSSRPALESHPPEEVSSPPGRPFSPSGGSLDPARGCDYLFALPDGRRRGRAQRAEDPFASDASVTAPRAMSLTKKQLAHLEKRLQDERSRALRSLGLFDEMAKADRETADSDLTAYTDHMADQGTEAMEREKAAVFATKEGRYLYRIEEALRRLYNDPENFGYCHTCGAEVGFERLDALPHARYCIDCKVKEEEAA